MTKVIPISALATPFSRIFPRIASSVPETDAIVANAAKTFSVKGTETSVKVNSSSSR